MCPPKQKNTISTIKQQPKRKRIQSDRFCCPAPCLPTSPASPREASNRSCSLWRKKSDIVRMTPLQHDPQQHQCEAKHRQFRVSRASKWSPDSEAARTMQHKSGLHSKRLREPGCGTTSGVLPVPSGIHACGAAGSGAGGAVAQRRRHREYSGSGPPPLCAKSMS
jgi:hypothetical protein